jgi:hypothetical protein
LEKGTLHNWYGALREAMMRAKEDKKQVRTIKSQESRTKAGKEDKSQISRTKVRLRGQT